MKTLKDQFQNTLADMYDAECRSVEALPKMARAATSADLTRAFLSILKETQGQMTKLEQVYECFGEKAGGKTHEGATELLAGRGEIAADFNGSPATDATLISVAQMMGPDAVASRGSLPEWAGLLGNKKAAALLLETLEEEKAVNELLNKLARAGSNRITLGKSAEAGSAGVTQKKPGKQQTFVSPVSASRNRTGLRSQNRPCNRDMVAGLSNS